MLIGYGRVSTDDQNLDLQRAALREAGCTRIYEEKLSGASRNRPELARLLDHLRSGDVVVVHRLDRLARSTRDLLDIAELIREAEAGLRSLSEPWADTTSPAGRMVLTIFAGIAEFERVLIHQRPGAGREAARAREQRRGPAARSRRLRPRPVGRFPPPLADRAPAGLCEHFEKFAINIIYAALAVSVRRRKNTRYRKISNRWCCRQRRACC